MYAKKLISIALLCLTPVAMIMAADELTLDKPVLIEEVKDNLELSAEPQNNTPKIYKKINPDGSVSYSSNGSESEQVDIKEANSISLDKMVLAPKAKIENTKYESIEIVSPKTAAVIEITGRELPTTETINITINPELNTAAGHRLQLYANGKKVGKPSVSSTLTLSDIYRGEYTLTVSVINKNNKQIKKSAPISISFRQRTAKRKQNI